MDVADLKPNVFFCQRPRGICNDVFEALEQFFSKSSGNRKDWLIPLGFDYIFAAVCRLSQDGNISRSPFQSRVAYALPGRRPPRHAQEIRSDRKEYQYHTRVSVPAINILAKDENMR